jgi:hypothetical protein
VFFDPAKNSFGASIMQGHGAALSPIPFGGLPADVRTALGLSSVMNMNDGSNWDLMSFHLSGKTRDTTQWVPGESMKGPLATLTGQSEKLPENLKKDIKPELPTMAAISVTEGGFGGKSIDSDNTGSLGIFQWGMKKKEQDSTSSMAAFFRTLKQRATAPVAAGGPTKDQQLYIEAWKACKGKGLDIDGRGFITLNGKRANGKEVEDAMHGVMGSDDHLKTYQLVAGRDWIQEFKSTKVDPSNVGDFHLGSNFQYGKDSATLQSDEKHSISISAPATASTVGDYLSSDKALAMAITLGVNKPHHLPFALWRALAPGEKPRERTKELVQALVREFPATKKPITIDKDAADKAGPAAAAAFAALQSYLWPAKTAINEDSFIPEFQKQALALYPADEMKKFHREKRFATIEGAFHE